jgi:hypothetical protein
MKYRGEISMRLAIMMVLMLLLSACNLNNSQTSSEDSAGNPIIYYVFANEGAVSDGSISLAGIILSPVEANENLGADTAENLRQALELMINEDSNLWTSSGVEIVDISFNSGHAVIGLAGDISGTGGAVLSAASNQFLLTIFANPAVETAVVILNGETIANLGISHSSQAKPADYRYSREEIQDFIASNAAQS